MEKPLSLYFSFAVKAQTAALNYLGRFSCS